MKFEQIPKETDCVRPSMFDLFFGLQVVVVVTLRHIVTLTNPVEREPLGDITTPIRIRFFPIINVERSLCLADIREVRKFDMKEFGESEIPDDMPRYMIPYGYTINQP